MQTTLARPQWRFELPADFPAARYLETRDTRDFPFQSVPYRNKWKMRHKIAYVLHCRASLNEAEKLNWGDDFMRTYERVCACISFRESRWQARHWPKYDRMVKAHERNRAILGYVRN